MMQTYYIVNICQYFCYGIGNSTYSKLINIELDILGKCIARISLLKNQEIQDFNRCVSKS